MTQLGGACLEQREMLHVFLPTEKLLGGDEVSEGTDLDRRAVDVNRDSRADQFDVAALEASWFEHNVDHPDGRHEPDRDRRPEDVARFQPATVNLQSL